MIPTQTHRAEVASIAVRTRTLIERTYVQTQCSNINRKLKKSLPAPTAAKLEIISLAEGTDTRYVVTSYQSGCVLNIVE